MRDFRKIKGRSKKNRKPKRLPRKLKKDIINRYGWQHYRHLMVRPWKSKFFVNYTSTIDLTESRRTKVDIDYPTFVELYGNISNNLFCSICGAYKHFNDRLRIKFNEGISLDVYMNTYVREYDLSKCIFKGRNPKFIKGGKVYVYNRMEKLEYPLTVYPISHNKQRKWVKL